MLLEPRDRECIYVNRWGRCLLLLLKVSGSNKRYRLVRNGDLKMGHTPHMAIFMGFKIIGLWGFVFVLLEPRGFVPVARSHGNACGVQSSAW